MMHSEAVPTGVAIGLIIMFSVIPLMFLVGVLEEIMGWHGNIAFGWGGGLCITVFTVGICWVVIAGLV